MRQWEWEGKPVEEMDAPELRSALIETAMLLESYRKADFDRQMRFADDLMQTSRSSCPTCNGTGWHGGVEIYGECDDCAGRGWE